MARQLKKSLIILLGTLMLAFVGVFFVGCGTDFSSIYLSSDTDVITLEVGESQTVTFSIENYSSSFSNNVQVNPYSDGNTTIFSVSEPVFATPSTFSVTVTAVAGGTGTLNVVTLQGAKEFSIPVSVTQYSTSLAFTDEVMYVSDSTDFTPTHGNFTFDVNTTEKGVSYFCFDADDEKWAEIDVSQGYSLYDMASIGTGVYSVTFSGSNGTAVKTAYQFDTVSLDSGEVTLSFEGSAVKSFSDVSTLSVLAIYNAKEDELGSSDVIWDLGTVYVLPDLSVSVTGGYATSTSLSLSQTLTSGTSITISPNYSEMSQYIIRIEREDVSSETAVVTDFSLTDNSINVQYLTTDEVEELYQLDSSLSSEDSGKNVEYLRILSSTQIEANVALNVSCHYEVLENVADESVNVSLDLDLSVKIAPTSIVVNGSENPDILTVYCNYSEPDFGWNSLTFEVISNYATSPNITGVYFTYSSNLEFVTQDNVAVRQGSGYLYSNLDSTFKVRGQSYTGDATITVHVYCDWGDFDDVSIVVNFVVRSGASELAITEATPSTVISGTGSTQSTMANISIDLSGGSKTFFTTNASEEVIGMYADDFFQSLTFEQISGTDIVSFSFDESEVCQEVYDNKLGVNIYYLVFSITPKLTGTATYRIYTDNGTSTYISVTCINSLTDAKIVLSSSGNDAVSYYEYQTCEENGAFSQSLYVEVENTYSGSELQTGKSVTLQIEGNYTSSSTTNPLTAEIVYDENVAAFSSVYTSGTSFTVSTLANGNATITVTIGGYVVYNFQRVEVTMKGYVFLSAYSLLDSFYLKNGDDYALSSTIYYGPEETKSVTLTPYAESEGSSNFFMYSFTDSALQAMFEAGRGGSTTFSITSSNYDEYITKNLVNEAYNQKFIFYSANKSNGSSWGESTITLSFLYYEGIKEMTFTVNVSIYSGLMFYVDLESLYTLEADGIEYQVKISTSNKYQVGGVGTFDLNTCTYTQTGAIGEEEVVLSASIEQRNSTLKRYDAHIYVKNYEYAETITLISSTTDLYFSSKELTKTINVSVYPTTATNPEIHVEYVPDNSTYANLISYTIVNNGNGNYTIRLSCQTFYNSTTDIQNITDSLSGTLYVYPSDWGSSHTELGYIQTVNGAEVEVSVQPIEISINFQNGSENNPYLLSTVQDVLDINSDATMLASHYRIASQIDMTGVTSTPLGILTSTNTNGETSLTLVGFSGSIEGTNSQASIVGIDASKWTASVDGITYSGLFAKINSEATITNVSFSGEIEGLEVSSTYAYASLLTSLNFGTLTAVAVELDESSIYVADGTTLFFGAVAGINYGEIVQDFTLFESGATYSGLQTKILTYFNDALTITGGGTNAIVYSGGIVGSNAGLLQRIESDSLTLYGTSRYSAYTLISVEGTFGTAYVGGVAGAASGVGNGDPYEGVVPYATDFYTKTYDDENEWSTSILDNLLVGGEISTLSATVTNDAVGGIVGYVRGGANSTSVKYYVSITNNTARVFVRGHDYVGAVIGIDFCEKSVGDPSAEGYLTISDNVIQAVDDARTGIWASMVIKTNSANYNTLSTDAEILIYSAVGSAYMTAPVFGLSSQTSTENSTRASYDGAFTSAISYLQRTKVVIDNNTTYAIDTSLKTHYYGDVVVLSTSTVSEAEISVQIFFETGDVVVSLDDSASSFKLENDSGTKSVYYMTYFSVTSDLTGTSSTLKQDISALNVFTTNSSLYPFTIAQKDVSIKSSSSQVLSIDSSGTITLKGTGLATITISSILNTQTDSLVIYIYVIDYFDMNSSSSLFRTGSSMSSDEISNGESDKSGYIQYVYGDSYSTVYVVPTYSLSGTDSNGDAFTITEDGMLFYKNVWYYLSASTAVKVDISSEGSNATTAEPTGQSIVFHKNGTPTDGDKDTYTLTPYISITLDDKLEYKKVLSGSVTFDVVYRDTATDISTQKTYVSFQTSQDFSTTVSVTSTRDSENLYYIIFDEDENTVQMRIPSDEEIATISTTTVAESDYYTDENTFSSEYSTYEEAVKAYQTAVEKQIRNNLLAYLNTCTSDDLFEISFEQTYDNNFTFNCKVNKSSTAYKTNYENIFGVYTIVFYSSELYDGVSCQMQIELLRPELSYVAVSNYSNINSMSKEDETVVPNQRGVLEVTIDPSDAVFNTFTISNNSANTGTAMFSVAVEVVTKTGSVEFAVQENFGTFDEENGSLTFTYDDFLSLLESITTDNGYSYTAVEYYGRFYISYLMPSSGLQDGDAAGFDIEVNYGSDVTYETTIMMNIKLSSYAKLEFDSKEAIGDYYFLARGLSYTLTLDTYNFSSEDVSFDISNNERNYVTLVDNGNGTYTLTVTAANIVYPSNDKGYYVEITTKAQKTVDNVLVESEDVLKIYLMDFVFNYSYAQGVNEDIVSGMEDGIITMAVGNTLALQLDIYNFIEYSSALSDVVEAVSGFVDDFDNVTWKVIENNVETTLASGKTVKSDYYLISSLVVTPLKIYDPDEDIYHFSVYGQYVVKGGTYTFTTTSTGADTLYTEFSLKVHTQSTIDNPIPIYTYEELLEMEEGEWYILQDNITLPSDQIANAQGISTFSPLSTEIAGLDGNGYNIIFGSSSGSTYTFTDLTEVGLFSEVSDETTLSNITIVLYDDVIFEMNVSTFQVGLITATNNGNITNCEVRMRQDGDYELTVNCSVASSSSYVAGLVGTNAGYITNSRSSVNIFASDNLSGFVGVNNGHIASSYYRGGSLTNTSNNTSEYTAGLVVQNTGKIYSSYVSGDSDDNTESAYYTEDSDNITASGNAAGFVYVNSGTVSDCYSNIYMTYSGYYVAGFVFENTGMVTRSISWSVLPSNHNRSYGFAYSNDVDDSEHGIYDCFYLADSGTSVNVSISVLSSNEFTEIEALSLDEFADVSNFEAFSVSSGRDINAVWFFNTNKTSTANFKGQDFNIGRIELVAPNIIATSIRNLYSTTSTTDPDTGATYVVYNYIYSSSSASLGSMFNPILLSTADNFSSYITNENTASNANYQYYRVICDIDFSSGSCTTYATKFYGYFEGNYMTLSSVSLASSNSSTKYAGLFAEIGSSTDSSSIGTVMNLTLEATQIYFPSTNVVGGIAGRLDGGTLANVTVDGVEMVVGKNIVGGIVGAAIGAYSIHNAYSTASVVARNLSVGTNDFSSTDVANSKYSFAGSVVGVLSGSGSLYGSTTNTTISVLADKAGLMFGYVDSGVSVKAITLENQEDNTLSAYSYVGLVVGETRGNFEDVTIIGTGTAFGGFDMTLYVPTAIGTFAGLMSGGTVANISCDQSVSLSTTSSDSLCSNLGLVGLVNATSTISNVTIGASGSPVELVGYEYVGAVVGTARSASNSSISVNISGVEVYATLSALGIKQSGVAVGGVVGNAGYNSIVSVAGTSTMSTVDVDIRIQTTVYGSGTAILCGSGALVGYTSSSYAHSASNLTVEADISVSLSLLSGSQGTEKETSVLTIAKDATTNLVTLTESLPEGADSLEKYMSVTTIECSGVYTSGTITYIRTTNCTTPLQVSVFGVFTA